MDERMIFSETRLTDAFLIFPERIEDERGFFARTFCRREFAARGLPSDVVQCNLSFNTLKGTLRGMHYQIAPHAEAKLVRCTAGAIYDVIIDLRASSPTFRKWLAVELSAEHRNMLYIPEGFAHGFQTLADNTELLYQHFAFFSPESARGLRFDDPALGLVWPLPVSVISRQDKSWPLVDASFRGDAS